jgi:glucokinase
MILAGDIGGTKTLLAIFDEQQCLMDRHFDSGHYPSFQALLTEFLAFIPDLDIKAACIGVAGPIIEGNCRTTNLPWHLVTQDISAQLGTSNVVLINDLEAAAWGVLTLPSDQFVSLNPLVPLRSRQGNCAVIAAGTGLGEAIVFHDGQDFHVIASEGGHADFAPTTAQQIALLEFMQTRYPAHVSYERLLSGAGIVAIYAFLKQTQAYASSTALDDQLETASDAAAMIGAAAVAETDATAVAALTLFAQIYGAEAGNLALKCLPFGGVYLAGGIAPKCLPILAKGAFLEGFLAKGRYHQTLSEIAVHVCTEPQTGLLGARYVAQRRLS